MEGFYKSGKFIIGFLSITLAIESAFGEKVSENMCLFVLFSMVILNASKFSSFLKGFIPSENGKDNSGTDNGKDNSAGDSGSINFDYERG